MWQVCGRGICCTADKKSDFSLKKGDLLNPRDKQSLEGTFQIALSNRQKGNHSFGILIHEITREVQLGFWEKLNRHLSWVLKTIYEIEEHITREFYTRQKQGKISPLFVFFGKEFQ